MGSFFRKTLFRRQWSSVVEGGWSRNQLGHTWTLHEPCSVVEVTLCYRYRIIEVFPFLILKLYNLFPTKHYIWVILQSTKYISQRNWKQRQSWEGVCMWVIMIIIVMNLCWCWHWILTNLWSILKQYKSEDGNCLQYRTMKKLH